MTIDEKTLCQMHADANKMYMYQWCEKYRALLSASIADTAGANSPALQKLFEIQRAYAAQSDSTVVDSDTAGASEGQASEVKRSYVDWDLVERMRTGEEIDSEEAGMIGAMMDSQADEILSLRALLAATPASSVADAAWASDLEALLADITAIDTWHRGSPSYEHDAGWFKDRVVRLLEERIAKESGND